MLQKFTFLTFFLFLSFSTFAQRYLTEVFSEVQVDADVTYGQNISVLNMPNTGFPSTVDLKMDVYEPLGDTETNRPIVLFVHGGNYLPPIISGQCNGSKADNAAVEICTRLAKMGYVVASIDYRLGWNPLANDFEERISSLLIANYRGVQDVRTALRYFRMTEAEEGNPWGIDPTRAIVWGDGTGGSIALTAATVNSYDELISSPVSISSNGEPIITEEVNGDIYGTSIGVDITGDTLSIPNHVSYVSNFSLCVNTSGYLSAEEWLNAGDMPMISFHGINDLMYPYDDQTVILPTIDLFLLDAFGSRYIQELAQSFGNNQVFVEANIQDGFTDAANELNEGFEGLFPFMLDTTTINGIVYTLNNLPWNWVDEEPMIPPTYPPDYQFVNCSLDENMSKSKIDTLIGYFAPRAFAALCFGCQEFNANVYLDENDNGVFDGNDAPLQNIIAEFQPNNSHTNTNADGNLSKLFQEGDYTMTVTPPMYYQVTSTPYPVEFSVGLGGVFPNNPSISVIPTPGINDLMVSLLPLEAPMPGFDVEMKIVYKNQGTTIQDGTLTMNFADIFTFLESSVMGDVNGTAITWEIPDLAPLEMGEITVKFEVATNTLNDVAISDVSFESGEIDETPTDNFDQIQQVVIGSYDPNDKAVNPAQLDIDDAQGRYLTYLIRFQNTGTAPAVNIRVEDTLSQYLDINTLEILDVSHDYRMEITGNKNIAWHFDDIFLPDSTANEPESHGHIAFRVKTNLPADLPSSIDNQAFIYFDFNEAILTNIAKSEFLIDGVNNRNNLKIPMQIFPNPVKNEVNIESSWPVSINEIKVEVLDINGKIVQKKEVTTSGKNIKMTLNLEQLPTGIYQIKLSDNQFSTIQKLVKIN